MKNIKYIVGIDEAGRGPLAGPVAVGVFCIEKGKKNSLRKLFVGARDSKKMTAKKREEIFEKIIVAQNKFFLRHIVIKESAKVIDAKGISWAIKNCIKKGLQKLKVDPQETLVLLDGGIKAPMEFTYQKTIIKGDDKELVISLASICAKVTRDKYMEKMAKKYPQYGLEIHKGYGTLRHRMAIRQYGPSDIHRVTYLRNI